MPTLRFGLSRAHGGVQLLDGARQFTGVLGARLGQPLRVVRADDYDHLLEGVLVGGIDLSWLPPLVHLRAVDRGALLAAVCERRGVVVYRSALLVRHDSPFHSVGDLRGARAAWSDPSSASGYLFPRLHLRAAGLEPQQDLASESFLGSTAQACLAVAEGRADLCTCFVSDAAGSDREVARADVARGTPPGAEGLRVLDVTDPIPPDGLVLGPNLDGATQARVRDALLTLHEDEPGRRACARLFGADRLVPANDAVMRIVSQLRLHAGLRR
jgi:phosphate/phosphite/phosphonate ABC transporter binding protein